MSNLTRKRSLGLGCLLAVVVSTLSSASALDLNFTPDFRLDQQSPKAAFGPNGGVIIWQDLQSANGSFTIKGLQLNKDLVIENGVFHINDESAEGVQENASVVTTPEGGYAYTWQGGLDAFQKIYLRLQSPDLVFKSAPVEVTPNAGYHSKPSVAVGDSRILVTWQTFNGTSTSAHDVFGRFYSLDGEALGTSFIVSRKISGNQRDAVTTPLNNDRFGVVWVDEYPNPSISDALPAQHLVRLAGKILSTPSDSFSADTYLSSSALFAANPSLRSPDGSTLMVAFSGKSQLAQDEGWDVFLLSTSASLSTISEVQVNTDSYGDQFAPVISISGESSLVVWSALGKDGSGHGVYGSRLDGSDDFLVNSTTFGHQLQPSAFPIDGSGSSLVLWSGFNSLEAGFDIFGKLLKDESVSPAAPLVFTYPLSSSAVTASFTTPIDVPAQEYEIKVTSPSQSSTVSTTGRQHTVTGLAPSSSVSFSVRYKTADGIYSLWSDDVSVESWGVDDNFDGLPDDWQIAYFGQDAFDNNPSLVAAYNDSDDDGASNLSEFLAGTDPTDASSVLKLSISTSSGDIMLTWNTVPGSQYVLQGSTNLKDWAAIGQPHFATDTQDSAIVLNPETATYFRLVKTR